MDAWEHYARGWTFPATAGRQIRGCGSLSSSGSAERRQSVISNREIMFRGKRVDNGEWAYGSLISFSSDEKAILPSNSKCFMPQGSTTFCTTECLDVAPLTVGQYTGLLDKNGKRIFEGDILGFINKYRNRNNTWKCTVEFIEGAFVCRHIQRDGNGLYNHFGSWNAPLVEWEVIGNIHDNPELLKGE